MGPHVAPALAQVTRPQPRRGTSETTASTTGVTSEAPSVEETTDWSLHEAMAATTISALNKAIEGGCIPRSFTRGQLPLNPTTRLFHRSIDSDQPRISLLQAAGFMPNSSTIQTFIEEATIADISSMVGAGRTSSNIGIL